MPLSTNEANPIISSITFVLKCSPRLKKSGIGDKIPDKSMTWRGGQKSGMLSERIGDF